MSDPLSGFKLDERYTLVDKVGSGSMGTVYRARQHTTARDVAIKILRGDKAVDAGSKARFMREARANSLLTSPNTVTVFDFGQAKSGELFLAMELLEGQSLGERLTDRKKLTPEEAVSVAIQVLASLAEAHAKGLVHRDLKPDNVFFSKVHGAQKEIVKVLDFGIAKFVTGDSPINAIETQAGTVFGTPRYMSPEQAQGKPLDGRSDLYSLGVILYHVLAGRAPFTDDDAVIVMARHIKAVPRPLRELDPTIHPKLEALVNKALSKLPDARFAGAEEMSEAFDALRAEGSFRTGATGPIPTAAGSDVDLSAASSSLDTVAEAVVLPQEKKRSPWSFVAMGLFTFVVVFVAMIRGVSTDVPVQALHQHESLSAFQAASSLPTRSPEVSAVDVQSLPAVPPTPPNPAQSNVGKGRPKPKSSASAPIPTASSGYGIFE